MIRLVVFDWNGTLFADARALKNGTNKVLKVLGREPISFSTYRQHFDSPTKMLYLNLGVSEADIALHGTAMVDAFHEYYEPRTNTMRTRVGAHKLLEGLKQRGVTSIILSNHTTEGITTQLERLGLAGYFDAVLANEHIYKAHAKGKAERLHDYMAQSHVPASDTLIVGDTVEEVQIGKALGMHTVAITGGTCTIARLRAEQPDAIVHKLAGVRKIVERLSKGEKL